MFVPYGILGVAAGGLGLLLLGVAVLVPITHRPLGFAALAISVLCLLAALWVMVRAREAVGRRHQRPVRAGRGGWYLFLATGVLGIIGAAKALAAP